MRIDIGDMIVLVQSNIVGLGVVDTGPRPNIFSFENWIEVDSHYHGISLIEKTVLSFTASDREKISAIKQHTREWGYHKAIHIPNTYTAYKLVHRDETP